MSYMCPLISLHLPQGVNMIVPCGAVAAFVFLQESRREGHYCKVCYNTTRASPETGLTRQLRVGDTALPALGLCICMLVGTTVPPLTR